MLIIFNCVNFHIYYQASYAVSMNNRSPEQLRPRAYVPLWAQEFYFLSAENIPMCDCAATQLNFQIRVSGEDVEQTVDRINNAVEGAWQNVNDGKLIYESLF